jgi:hypothetical protein
MSLHQSAWPSPLAWVGQLARDCTGYEFSIYRTFRGRAVIARQVKDGTGPVVVITPDEPEMRRALGVAADGSSS